jgi:hypothetical protein
MHKNPSLNTHDHSRNSGRYRRRKEIFMHSLLMTSILLLAILFPLNCLSAQDSDSTLLVHVDVEKPMQWSVEQLKGKFANQVQEVKARGMPDRLGKTALGIPLLPVIQTAGPQKNVPTPTKQVRAPRQVSYDLPKGQQLTGLIVSAIAVSPDGKQFVYSTPQGLYRYSEDGSPAKHIAGTEGFTEQPFFSLMANGSGISLSPTKK